MKKQYLMAFGVMLIIILSSSGNNEELQLLGCKTHLSKIILIVIYIKTILEWIFKGHFLKAYFKIKF